MPATIPPWLATMRQITGTRALDNGDNPVIMSWPQKIGELFPDTSNYCKDYTHDSIAWCGLTVGYCMAVSGIKPVFGDDAVSRFLWANAWAAFGTDAGGTPQPGDVMVFTWADGSHHVTLYEETSGNSYVCRGGNQDHQVKLSNFPKGRCTAIRRPPAAAIAPATAVHTPAQTQSRIVATVFGGASDPKTSAYDGHMIDDTELGVALPAHIADPRPNVTVSKDGRTVICKVVHIGPWNTDDAYWKTGTRPQAESGVDSQGHRTNGAGIDLTPAAAKAIGLIDKGEVDWEFVGAPLTTPFIHFPFHRDSTSPDLVQQLLAQLEAAKMPTTPTTPPAGGQPDIAALVAEALKVFQSLGGQGAQQPPATGGTAAAPDQVQQFIKLLSALIGDFGGQKGLGQVNGALGSTIGNLLDGKKSAIGIIGSVLTAVLHVVGPSAPAALTAAIGGGPLAPVILPIFLGLTAWGVLGKFEKWMPPTTPPKQ